LNGEEQVVFVGSFYRSVKKKDEVQQQHPDVD
jgi:hypothetical protein